MSRRTVLPRSPSLGWPAGVEWRPQNKLASAADASKTWLDRSQTCESQKSVRRSTIDWLAQSWREAELIAAESLGLAKQVRGPETQNYKMRLQLCNVLSKLPYSYVHKYGWIRPTGAARRSRARRPGRRDPSQGKTRCARASVAAACCG